MLTVKTPDEVFAVMKEAFPACPESETVPLSATLGRILYSAMESSEYVPGFDRSTVDGYAVRAADTFGCSESIPALLEVRGQIAMGEATGEKLHSGVCVYAPTGGAIPEGADAVVMVEHTEDYGDGTIGITKPAAPGENLIYKGDDVYPGKTVLPAGKLIGAQDIGALAAMGVSEVRVSRKLKVAVISTGDELVEVAATPKNGQIRDLNSPMLAALVTQAGCEPHCYGIIPDDAESLRTVLGKACSRCDVVLISGGSSVGAKDATGEVIASKGEILFHGIAMKPGKPAILGCQGSKPILGVPGYPVSGIIVIEELLKPLIDHWLKAPAAPRQYAKATLTRPVVSGLKYEEFVRVRMGYVGNRLMASPLSRGSGVVSSFMKADGILEVPQGLEGYEAGSEVNVRLLSRADKLENTLVVIGSHDPLLDELGDMLHVENNDVYMSSSHVGSMGGIMAIRRGEAHAAGCHLLDTATGQYNLSYMKKYFPNGGVKLIRCVGRQQGMMVAKGNPLNIQKFSDIAKEGMRYVNRQKGSGTRILTDYLCKQDKLNPASIYGYDREELTHTSVAAQIVSGSADAGMGIYSAAKLYDLDFIPICIEEYDLIIPDHAWDTPMVQQLITTLKSDTFKEKILALGGYTVENPGEIIEIK